MNIEFIDEKKYSESIKITEGVWLLMFGNGVYAIPNETGDTLFTWANEEDAESFASSLSEQELKPVFFPLTSLFGGVLGDPNTGLNAVAVSARFGVPALTFDKEEYCEKFM